MKIMLNGKCPACGAAMDAKTSFVCTTCWWKIPAKDRQQLSHMHRHKQNTKSKLEMVVRHLKAVPTNNPPPVQPVSTVTVDRTGEVQWSRSPT